MYLLNSSSKLLCMESRPIETVGVEGLVTGVAVWLLAFDIPSSSNSSIVSSFKIKYKVSGAIPVVSDCFPNVEIDACCTEGLLWSMEWVRFGFGVVTLLLPTVDVTNELKSRCMSGMLPAICFCKFSSVDPCCALSWL